MRALVIAPQPFFTARGTPFSVYYRTQALARLGRADEAVVDLEHYLRSAPEAPDAQRVRLLIDQLGRD